MEESFVAEFLIHDATTNLKHIARPGIAVRFLEFPTLTVYGNNEGRLVFNSGKACKFRMRPEVLKNALNKLPLYVMLIDAYPQNIRMLGTATVDLSSFATGQIKTKTEFKRNNIELFDPVRNVVSRVDISISITSANEVTELQAAPATEIYKNNTGKQPKRSLTPSKDAATDPEPVAQEKEKVKSEMGTMTDPVVTEKPQKETPKGPQRETYQPPPMFFTKQETTV